MRESSWYSAAPELAYRDYGAKIFFHIGEGDEVTVPSSKSVYLYNWGDWPLLFVGMDYDKYQARAGIVSGGGIVRPQDAYDQAVRIGCRVRIRCIPAFSGDGWSQVERGCVGYRAA